MEQVIEKEVALAKVSIQVATLRWDTVEESGSQGGYYLCQRLSDGHSAIRVGNLAPGEAFPRVRSVAFLPPMHPIQLYPPEQPFRILNCLFEKSFFENTTDIDPAQWSEHAEAFVTIHNKRLESMMQQIYAEVVRPAFASDLAIEAAGTLLVVEMARHARERLGAPKADAASARGLAPWQLRRIRERIDASLEVGYPSLADLSRLCGISQSHLMRTFKASTGWQIHKYIAEERLKAAKRMLAEEQLGLKEISARLGFSSPAYFATAFRRMTGVTPTEYRRQAAVQEVH